MRIAPPEFVAEMRRLFGAAYDVQWREHLGRWVVVSPTADGRLVDQTWGWFWRDVEDPTTKKRSLEKVPCQADGLPPFRDLVDREDQLAILVSMEKTYLFNRDDGDQSIGKRFSRIIGENMALRRKRQVERAHTFVGLLKAVDIRRPGWKKIHQRPEGAVLVASAAGVRRTPLFDHQNGKPS